MKRLGAFSIAFIISLGLISCNGQSGKEKKEAPDKNLPQTDVKVNKEYDEKGNLIRYDSTYSAYYSNISNDTTLRDSIFTNFKNQFNQRYFFSQEPFFQDFFFQDSLLKYDFYKNDFFSNRFRNNRQGMDSLFLKMDSLKNDFFHKQFVNPESKKIIPKKALDK